MIFAKASAAGGDADCAVMAGLLAARAARRTGDVALEESSLLAALAKASEFERPKVHLALTKCYEHRLKDWNKAMVHARCTGPAEGVPAQERREARLARKLAAPKPIA